MIESVSYLFIKPLKTNNSVKQSNKTTLTSFEDTFQKTKTEKGKKNTISTKKSTAKENTSVSKKTAEKIAIFTDPVTGKSVKYIDVSDDEKKTAVNNNASVSTTSASSMKKTKYDAYFKEAAKKYNISESLLKAIAKAESNFNPKDVSSAGAIGVMQLMPATVKELGIKNPYDARENILGGAKCIAAHLKKYNGNVSLALAAYNAGSGTVRKCGGVPSYCKSYISKVLSYQKAFETATAVG